MERSITYPLINTVEFTMSEDYASRIKLGDVVSMGVTPSPNFWKRWFPWFVLPPKPVRTYYKVTAVVSEGGGSVGFRAEEKRFD